MSESNITGTQKVAAFLLSLDKQVGAEVMRRLDPKVVANVAEAMTELEPALCSPDAVDRLFHELACTVHTQAGVRSQDKFQLYEILSSTFGPAEADRVIAGINERRRREHPLGFLDKVPADRIVRVQAFQVGPRQKWILFLCDEEGRLTEWKSYDYCNHVVLYNDE